MLVHRVSADVHGHVLASCPATHPFVDPLGDSNGELGRKPLRQMRSDQRIDPGALQLGRTPLELLYEHGNGNSRFHSESLQELLGSPQSGVVVKTLSGCTAHRGSVDVPVHSTLVDDAVLDLMVDEREFGLMLGHGIGDLWVYGRGGDILRDRTHCPQGCCPFRRPGLP